MYLKDNGLDEREKEGKDILYMMAVEGGDKSKLKKALQLSFRYGIL